MGSWLLVLGFIGCQAELLDVGAAPEPGTRGTPHPWDSGQGQQEPGWDWVVAMDGFSWVVEGALSGMPLPGGRRGLDDDLRFLHFEGLDLLISLTEETLDGEALLAFELDTLHLPIEDFTAPEPEQIDDFVAEVATRLDLGERVGVHCLGGLGRTGTMLATWFVHEGMTAEDAIAHVRDLRPGSIETEEQEQAIHDYAATL